MYYQLIDAARHNSDRAGTMPRTCTVCPHPDRAAIDRALVRGEDVTAVSALFRVSADALTRHRDRHLPTLLAKARTAEEVAEAYDLLAQVRDLHATTLALLDKAEAAGKLGVAVMAVREARGNLELLAKLTQQLDTRPTLNLLVAPEWLTVRAVLLEALAAYPEARATVAEHLLRVEGSEM